MKEFEVIILKKFDEGNLCFIKMYTEYIIHVDKYDDLLKIIQDNEIIISSMCFKYKLKFKDVVRQINIHYKRIKKENN